MSAVKAIESPFTREKVAELRVGDRVRLTGRIYTGRDRLHKFLCEGGKCPADLKDGALYHCGPVMIRDGAGWRVVAAGPTTSMREEPYAARVIRNCQVRVLIGKGGMGESTRQACAQFGCVYLQAVGGAAGVLAQTVERVGGVHFLREFGSAEAMWELCVKGFEAVVTMDARGRSLHRRVRTASARELKALLAAAGQ
jgi:tartrate/fumarate subfamily iron-sulfur-dependent hydro-lyase beta chain